MLVAEFPAVLKRGQAPAEVVAEGSASRHTQVQLLGRSEVAVNPAQDEIVRAVGLRVALRIPLREKDIPGGCFRIVLA